jgi:hypothetical protein
MLATLVFAASPASAYIVGPPVPGDGDVVEAIRQLDTMSGD